jgi:hypothetical protein
MKIKIKSVPVFADKQVWIDYKSIQRVESSINESLSQTAVCWFRLIDENEMELIPFVPTTLKNDLYLSWNGTDEHFGELLIETLGWEKSP